ncbi:putative Transposase [Phytophthora cinnamomi]|uniref:putative Transposase n=1 Tax=Phytophthora cinnamomi TaxID=4785 RepID=UPI003559F1A4|nr:putative Transposase [Phytophthora cinnamomi]
MASEMQPPTTNVGLFAVADEPALPAASEPPAKKRKSGSGRKKDAVWDQTTVLSDKRVICNRCGALIHRYGVAKVERVRKHFERKCPGTREPTPTARGEEAVTIVTTETVGASESSDAAVLLGAGAGATTVAVTDASRHRTSSYGSKNGAFKRKFAYWLYATGQCFDNVENELLLGALRVLRGDVALPTKHELENELLDLEFTGSKNKVTKAITAKKCCLTIENWVDAGGCSVTTYGVVSEGAPYFLEAKTAATQQFSGELLVGEVEAVMAKEKKAEFYGIVTPTTSTLSKYTREKIMKKHPRCTFFYGCVCNALTLLLKDVTSVLPWLEKVQASVAELADVFHGNHKLQVLMSATDSNPPGGVPDSSSVCAVLDAVLKHEKGLYTVVARRDFVDASTPVEQEKLRRVQDFVLGESFVQDLINALAILRPLQQHLKHFQEDRPPLSQVFPYFVELLTVYSSMEWLSKKEKALITSCVSERFNAIYGDAHGVAYLLDPLYMGEALDERKKQEVESFIVRFCENEGHSVDIFSQLGMYKGMVAELKQGNPAYWQLVQSGAVSPHDFWMERRGQCPHLHQLAVAVFALPAASSSPSPSLAVQGFDVTSRFNRTLKPDQLQKLMHVYCNSRREDHESMLSIPQQL